MSQTTTTTPQTKANQLDAFLHAHKGQWIDGRHLEAVAGTYAWRTRVSELRTKRGRDIRNRQSRFVGKDGQVYTLSEYRLVGR